MNWLRAMQITAWALFVSLNRKFWEELIAYIPWHDTDRIENEASNNISIVACVLVAAVTFLPSRCLATIGGMHI
jgi:hypothetical protein